MYETLPLDATDNRSTQTRPTDLPLKQVDPEIWQAIEDEKRRQHDKIELIASENYVSRAVLDAQGSVLTNKYAEGYPGKRYYGGCEYVDVAENLAIARAKQLFGADHVNVQPHSGAQANMAVYMAVLQPGDSIMGMGLAFGGHLTHGYGVNFSGKLYHATSYAVDRETERLNYDAIQEQILVDKPKMLVVGASAYSRIIDFERCRQIADSVGAMLMVDMAHIAGLVAAGLHPSPVPYADFVTTTTHKTLRGPRGGMVLCRAQYAKDIDKSVFPGIQGGPLMHVIAAKAVAFHEALQPSFKEYQAQIVANAKRLASGLEDAGLRVVSGGTDNHLMMVDVSPLGQTGRDAEHALDEVGITVNKNAIPYDPQPPAKASGIRVGTPAVTTRGFREPEMDTIARMIGSILRSPNDEAVKQSVSAEVLDLCGRFPVPGIEAQG